MKHLVVLTSAFFMLFLSCKNKNSDQVDAANSKDSLNTEPFYPITQYIQQQIAYVDSTPLAIEKHTYFNNRLIDSTTIDRTIFQQLAADFLSPDLNDEKLKPLYKEDKFHDQTINTLTFSYNAKNTDQQLQQRDILLDPETQRVRMAMFRKVEHKGDTTITINGLWKHNMNFQLNYIIEPASGPMQTKQIRIIWDRPMENP
jgi:hypothetical protein